MIDPLTGTEITISNDLVTLEFAPFAETVVEVGVGDIELEVAPFAETVVEVGEVELEIAPFAETVVEVGVGDIVEVEADSTGLPEVEVFGLDVTELANPSAIGTLAFLAGFFGFV